MAQKCIKQLSLINDGFFTVTLYEGFSVRSRKGIFISPGIIQLTNDVTSRLVALFFSIHLSFEISNKKKHFAEKVTLSYDKWAGKWGHSSSVIALNDPKCAFTENYVLQFNYQIVCKIFSWQKIVTFNRRKVIYIT